MAAAVVPLLTEAGNLILQALLPDLIKWIEARAAGGTSPEAAAAELRLLFDAADLVADVAEDQKFGKPSP
jgi:hypothetical protein